ncbi:hypothetical protein PP175_26375 (plasmid) [Aneurinibacillus sp. Ricciae_BoGa-3]|uniref:hypothetical protein n=1 Tax=Aneurinibacillus sp. Ricciae_BoGa-3 TaxID=3022697 RepID=UPI002341ACC1|nr:hypothetical protein [Aneurinibacillus sp. Ricciae_BoGa-3]WCK57594.1 hypothetical protein PP175_26375 [Aneurinibacillus sp. Ricciae_BoGa-3]
MRTSKNEQATVDNACPKCNGETVSKRATVHLQINKHTSMPVAARIQKCKMCGAVNYSSKERNRLQELLSFYAKEETAEVEEKEKEQAFL